jgi:hypothetical protein
MLLKSVANDQVESTSRKVSQNDQIDSASQKVSQNDQVRVLQPKSMQMIKYIPQAEMCCK